MQPLSGSLHSLCFASVGLTRGCPGFFSAPILQYIRGEGALAEASKRFPAFPPQQSCDSSAEECSFGFISWLTRFTKRGWISPAPAVRQQMWLGGTFSIYSEVQVQSRLSFPERIIYPLASTHEILDPRCDLENLIE